MRIKGFDEDLKCRGMQFEIGKEYKIDSGKLLRLCSDTVFHYCKTLEGVHNFYNCRNIRHRFCEIEVLGKEITDGVKCGSNHIKIVREIVGEELNRLKGLTNGNRGLFNRGQYNKGDSNIGDHNVGDLNNGDYNEGDLNRGDCNEGGLNNGDHNVGIRNRGIYNNGNYNNGYYNNGDHNLGTSNNGYGNRGCFNNGDHNAGYFNACNNSRGVFCNEEENIRIFNQPSEMNLSEFKDSRYYKALTSENLDLTRVVRTMHEDGGVRRSLEAVPYKEACQHWWNELTPYNKAIIQEIPNFDKKIFEDITGIKL